MHRKCVICEKELNGSMHQLMKISYELMGQEYLCKECAKIAGLPTGFGSEIVIATYTVNRIIKKYNQAVTEDWQKIDLETIKRRIAEDNQKQAEEIRSKWEEIKSNSQKKYDESQRKQAVNRFNKLERKLNRMIVRNPKIVLRKNEVCYFQKKAFGIHKKNVVTGSWRTGSYSGVRIGRYSLGGSSGHSFNTRGNVTEKSAGMLFITNQRIVLSSPKFGFEIPLKKITTLQFETKNFFVSSNGKTYSVETDYVYQIKSLIETNNEYLLIKEQYGLSNTQTKSVNKSETVSNNTEFNEKEIPNLIREYKQLFDDGLISEEDFEKKKKQLLKS